MTSADHHHFAAPSAASTHQGEQSAIDQLNELAAAHRKFTCILVTPYALAKQIDERAARDAVTWLSRLPIAAVAAEHARVFLWSPGPHVFRLLDMLPAWDCHYETAGMCVVPPPAAEEVSLLFQSSCGSELGRRLACPHVLPCLSSARSVNEDLLRAAVEKPHDAGRLHVFARTPAAGWTTVGA